jgi:hypothetical protein
LRCHGILQSSLTSTISAIHFHCRRGEEKTYFLDRWKETRPFVVATFSFLPFWARTIGIQLVPIEPPLYSQSRFVKLSAQAKTIADRQTALLAENDDGTADLLSLRQRPIVFRQTIGLGSLAAQSPRLVS